MRPILFAAVAAAFLAAACSSNGDDDATPTSAASNPTSTLAPGVTPEPTTDTSADQAMAESLILTVADLPTGWVVEEGSDSERICPDARDAEGLTGYAGSDDLKPNQYDNVTHFVAVFESAEIATAGMAVLDAWTTCMADAIEDGELDDDDVRWIDPTPGVISFDPVGDESRAFRLSFTAHSPDDDARASITGDLVVFRKGRVVMGLWAVGLFSPFDFNAVRDLAQKAVAKVP